MTETSERGPKLNYDHLLYKRGYLFSEAEVEPPVSSWRRQPVGDYHICFDPENPFAFRQTGASWVAFLGRAVDVLHWTADVDTIAQACLDKLALSEEQLLDYVDRLSGRFALIYHRDGTTRFMTDAFGTRSAFYHLEGRFIVSSHCKIISDYLNLGQSVQLAAIKADSRWLDTSGHAYPGILSPYEGVWVLTPNTLISIEDRRITRFYPRCELSVGNLSEVAEEVAVMLKRQIELLHGSNSLVISLSAGIDTRTALAAARDIARDLLFFTYGDAGYLDITRTPAQCEDYSEVAAAINRVRTYAKKTLRNDVLITSDIAQAFDLRHIRLEDGTAYEEGFQEFNRVLDCNTYYRHARRLAKAYLEQLPSSTVHIRSNVSGIASAIFRRQGYELPLTEEKMAQVRVRMGHNRSAVEAFRQFTGVTGFGNICNYDPYEMFLWEHHIGTWLPNVLLESDPAFDTLHLFNCRTLVEKVLSVPVEERMNSKVHREIINRLWPALLQWPINEPPFKVQLEELRADQAKLKEQADGLRRERDSLRKERDSLKKGRDKLKGRLRATEASFSYRLGRLVVEAVATPGRNTVLLPYRLVRLGVEGLRRWRGRGE